MESAAQRSVTESRPSRSGEEEDEETVALGGTAVGWVVASWVVVTSIQNTNDTTVLVQA